MGKIVESKMTKADAAKLVHRMVARTDENGKPILDKEGNPVGVKAPVKTDEVMAFAEYDDKVVVVTAAGEKLTYEKPAK